MKTSSEKIDGIERVVQNVNSEHYVQVFTLPFFLFHGIHTLCFYSLDRTYIDKSKGDGMNMVEYWVSIMLKNLIHLFCSFPRVVNPSFAQDVALRSFQPSVWLLHFRLISLSDHVVFTGAEHFQAPSLLTYKHNIISSFL